MNITNPLFKEMLKLGAVTKKNIIKINNKTRDIKVNIRNQFSPSQIIKLLKEYSFKVTNIHPINYHPATPKVYNSNLEYKKISDKIVSYNNKLSLIPFSSSFIVAAKKV
jgi:hypothetical protein